MDIQQTIGFQIKQLANHLNRAAHRQIAKTELIDIPETQQWILSYLYDHQQEEIFPSDLQQVFDFGKSTISELLTRMQKNKLVLLKQSTNDHRRKQVLLTTASLQKAEAVDNSISELENCLTAGMTAKQLENFSTLTRRLSRNLKSHE
ncbi:MAG: MarR family winged helix-turn-helix transcriptional regulator [Liquorilactobacillus ghanensis]|uniref:MarR family winged helix-turn-helix transcriptional regulator n=1 Tax=Liquorilactobacillus ghanensis TaxID=399370 RepID=UPI0039EC413D